MISCETFRASFQVDDRRPEILEHLRRCDACLHFALEVDQDVLFRSIGGDGLVPPGGVDQFAAGVMKQIELRRKSSDMAHHRHPGVLMRWAAAAVIVTGLATSSVVYRRHGASPVAQQASIRVAAAVTRPADPSTRSVIESYASDDATIMEVPVTSDNNVKVVMIFDQSLPADL